MRNLKHSPHFLKEKEKRKEIHILKYKESLTK